MQKKKTIAIDLMGNDNPPELLYKVCLEEEKKTGANFVYIGTKEVEKIAKKNSSNFVKAKSVITLHDHPLLALRKKIDSSMAMGMKLLKENKVDGFVSAGNSGALMSLAKINLNMLPKLQRPALCVLFPSKDKIITVLDVGATINVKAASLLQYAYIGSAYQKTRGIKKPKVGLLNIGAEAKKGTLELKKAYDLLCNENSAFEFIGNIEAKEVFEGLIDVLVTDGFTGNIFLKTSEGLANFVLDIMKKCKTSCPPITPYFDELKKCLHYETYPGALLIGTDKVIVKCHSSGSPSSFVNAVKGCYSYTENNLIDSIKKNI